MKQIKRLFAIDPWKISTTQLDKKKSSTARISDKYWKRLYGDAWEL